MTDFCPHFRVSNTASARDIYRILKQQHQHYPLHSSSAVIVIGGDGKMLETLGRLLKRQQQATQKQPIPVYGLNAGHVGFLLNKAESSEPIHQRVALARPAELAPLKARLYREGKPTQVDFAINEISVLRKVAQSAKLELCVNGRSYLQLESCDGILVATPAGSTAYNRAVGGPILPILSRLIAVTPINAYRPSSWKGALLDESTHVSIHVCEAFKRPVVVGVDNRSYPDIEKISVSISKPDRLTLLFDQHHDFEQRILSEQFRT